VEEIQNGLRGLLKIVRAIYVIGSFVTCASYAKWKNRKDHHAQRRAYAKNSQYHCQIMAKALGVRVQSKGHPVADSNFLYIGNHMGFIDIFAVSSLFPALFITSQEMRETPFLGTLCELAGCIFVERRRRSQIMNELNNLTDALKEGFNVVLYPEATSTDGEKVLPFKKTLMMSAPHSNRPIQPGVINFIEIDGEKFSVSNRDRVCWYGDMSFLQAIWGTATAKSIVAEVEFLAPIHATPDMDRGHIAERAHHAVKAKYVPPLGLSPIKKS
jgi:1-acyl-sn-glycerol-3-phosphate acyltransferase